MGRIESERLVDHRSGPAFQAERPARPRYVEPRIRIGRIEAERRIERGEGLLRSSQGEEKPAFAAIRKVAPSRGGTNRGLAGLEGLVHPSQVRLKLSLKEKHFLVGRFDPCEDREGLLLPLEQT